MEMVGCQGTLAFLSPRSKGTINEYQHTERAPTSLLTPVDFYKNNGLAINYALATKQLPESCDVSREWKASKDTPYREQAV